MTQPAPGEFLAHNVLQCEALFERFLVGFDEGNRTRQAPAMPNHAAWTLGHLALTAHRCVDRVLGMNEPGELPPDAFVVGERGDAQRVATESVSFGSVPTDDPDRYPTLSRSVEIMHGAHQRLAAELRKADAAALARQTPWGAGHTTVSDLALRMGFHIATHCGQVVDLRRGLGFEPVLGKR
ncbi:MAG: DinB family protein [Phycisphaerales bacterium]|jgi:hypothetical protein